VALADYVLQPLRAHQLGQRRRWFRFGEQLGIGGCKWHSSGKS
jgi:hypothetical protein